jgi:hypothetical protein
VLFVDEAFWAGDKRGEHELKSMITEDTLFIEPKNKDGYQAPNRLKIILASNQDWVIPAAWDERRFFVLEVDGAHAKDTKYFRAVKEAWDAGEAAALLDHLLAMDISDFDHRNPPHNKGLNEQKIQSLQGVPAWWHDALTHGQLTAGASVGWPAGSPLSKNELYDDYLAFARRERFSRPVAKNVFFRDLGKLLPEGQHARRMSTNGRTPMFVPPELAEAKQAMAEAMQVPLEQLYP